MNNSNSNIDVKSVLDAIRIAPDSTVYPPQGAPTINSQHTLPNDVQEFYLLCGGATLFQSSVFPTYIVHPSEVVLANPVILIGITQDELARSSKYSPTWSWYIIGKGPDSQYMTIDFNNERLGQCHNSFWSSHADDAPIIALSFTEFLYKSLFFSNLGKKYYWEEDEGVSPG